MTPSRRRLLGTLAAAGLGTLAGCSGGGDGDGADSPTDTPTATPTDRITPTTSEAATPTPTDDGGGDIVPTPTPTPGPAQLTATDGDGNDEFGWAVSVSADGAVACIGALDDEDPNGDQAGSAYLFERGADGWRQVAKVADPNGTREDSFGAATAVAGDGRTALVGAPNKEGRDVFVDGEGAVFVYTRTDEGWERAEVLRNAEDEFNELGADLALSADGSVALLGAPSEKTRDRSGDAAGAAYVFERADGGWSRTAELTAAARDAGDALGESVALSADGTVALAGAPGETENGEDSGAVYVFGRTGGEWRERAAIRSGNGDVEDEFGETVALAPDGSRALVGAPLDEDPNGPESGAVYAFERTDGDWRETARLVPGDGDGRDRFGRAVGLFDDGTRAVVGAPGDEDPNGDAAGAAYLFERGADGWRETAKLVAPDGVPEDRLGRAVAAGRTGGPVLVGAPFLGGSESAGAAYAFDRSASGQ